MSLDFYAEQSAVTDPGRMAEWLPDLPAEMAALRHIARGLVVHYRAEDVGALGIPEDRLTEINTRFAERMLERLRALDPRPLSPARPPEKRLVGCCRDFTVLFLMLLRRRGIPARARVGFATYFVPDWNVDHEVAEVWDAADELWRLVDAQLADGHVDPTDGAVLDPLDLPRDRFLVAGAAWRACRAGQAAPERFLVDPSLEIDETRGWPQLRHNLVQDLAALNKAEMLLWDTWGMLEKEQGERDLDLLDRIAELTSRETPAISEIRALYASEPDLQVPSEVTSFNLVTGTPQRVKIQL